MPFNTDTFRGSLKSVVSPSQFRVVFEAIPIGVGADGSRELSYRCESTQLPGKTIATTEYRDYGPIHKVGYETVYPETTMSLILTDSYDEYNLFERWSDYFQDNNGAADVEYYDNYVGRIRIDQHSKDGSVIKSIRLHEAYPTTIGPVELSWEAQNQYSKFDLTVTYRYWTSV